MSKARDIADLLDANGDVKSTALDNVPPSDDASALTTGTLNNARLPSNISDTGNEGTKIASGSSAQRGNIAGQFRFNTSTGLAEYYTGTSFKSIDAPPSISSLDVTEVDSQAGGNQTFVITGTGFASGATIDFIGANGTNFSASTVTVDSETQITAVAPKASFLNAQEPYGVKVTNTNNLFGTINNQINVDTSPSWQTASGNLGSLDEGTNANFTVSATDPDGDTVAYSETTSVLSGAGFSLNSSSGAITGTAADVSADTTHIFTLRATANSKFVDRVFNIIVNNPPAGGDLIAEYTYSGTTYKIHKFTSSGNFIIGSPYTVDYLIVGGGGGGGKHSGGGGGAGGLVWFSGQTLSSGTYAVTVGDGGLGKTSDGHGPSGGNSSFNSHIALGGGGGAYYATSGSSGGSGGGGSRGSSGGSSTQNSTYGYGYGNSGSSSASGYAPGHAGGGAGASGSDKVGGAGKSNFINSSDAETTAFLLGSIAGTDSGNSATTSSSSGTLYIAGGGGGSHQNQGGNMSPGVGGGGRGSDGGGGITAINAVANTGGGGGGGSNSYVASNGAAGVVIVRYTI